jgi:hypothetical protein
VRFVFYRRVSGVWQLYEQRDVLINPLPFYVNGVVNPLYGKACHELDVPVGRRVVCPLAGSADPVQREQRLGTSRAVLRR